MDVQRNMEANVEKRTKDSYGPPPGKRLMVFIDDMNMPQVSINLIFCLPLQNNCRKFLLQVDTYGTQQPIALLKLLVERGFMYDRGKDLNLKNFRDISYLAAMGKVNRMKSVFQLRDILYVICFSNMSTTICLPEFCYFQKHPLRLYFLVSDFLPSIPMSKALPFRIYSKFSE